MSKETRITFEIDMNQENSQKAVRAIDRHLMANSFTNQNSNVDEDWASVSYKTNRSLGDISNIQSYLFKQLQTSNIRVSSDILQHIPMLTVASTDFDKNEDMISSLGIVNKTPDLVEISFDTSIERDAALESLNQAGIKSEIYFNEINLESKNNYAISKKSTLTR